MRIVSNRSWEEGGKRRWKSCGQHQVPSPFLILLPPSPLQFTVAAVPTLLGTLGGSTAAAVPMCAETSRYLGVYIPCHAQRSSAPCHRRDNSEVPSPSNSTVQNRKQATYVILHFSSSHINMNSNIFYL